MAFECVHFRISCFHFCKKVLRLCRILKQKIIFWNVMNILSSHNDRSLEVSTRFKFSIWFEFGTIFQKMFCLDSEIYGRVSKKWNDMMFQTKCNAKYINRTFKMTWALNNFDKHVVPSEWNIVVCFCFFVCACNHSKQKFFFYIFVILKMILHL